MEWKVLRKRRKDFCFLSSSLAAWLGLYLTSYHSNTPPQTRTYKPSVLENAWNASIHQMRRSWPSMGCPQMLSSAGSYKPSYHSFFKDSQKMDIPIEPLIGTLHHPRTACPATATAGDFHSSSAPLTWIMLPPISLVKSDPSTRLILLHIPPENRRRSMLPVRSMFSKNGMPFDMVLSAASVKDTNATKLDYVVAMVEDDFPDALFNDDSVMDLLDEIFLDQRTSGSPMLQVFLSHPLFLMHLATCFHRHKHTHHDTYFLAFVNKRSGEKLLHSTRTSPTHMPCWQS